MWVVVSDLGHKLTNCPGGRGQQGRACTTRRANGKQTPGYGEDCSYRRSECSRDGGTWAVSHTQCTKWHRDKTSSSRILQEEIKKLEVLARKPLVKQTLDHEEDRKIIQQIFQRVNEATMSFQVHTLVFTYVLFVFNVFALCSFAV
jgi:hypothetical protein